MQSTAGPLRRACYVIHTYLQGMKTPLILADLAKGNHTNRLQFHHF